MDKSGLPVEDVPLKALYGLPLQVRFCRSCVISNQRPSSVVEFKNRPADAKPTIYFDEATTHQLIERFHSTLLPGGWLIVGHAEPQASANQQLELHNFPQTVVYRKRLDAPVFSPRVPENQL